MVLGQFLSFFSKLSISIKLENSVLKVENLFCLNDHLFNEKEVGMLNFLLGEKNETCI